MAEKDVLYIVVPCYNEEEVLHETTKRLTDKLNRMIAAKLISENSRIAYVNDGSKDRTWEIIEELHKENKFVNGIKLSRNRGHQNALLGGLMTVKDHCDMAISMDADLQDDIEVLDEFVRKYENGCHVVYGVRSARKKDTFFKKHTAQAFYKMMSAMGVDIVYNHADYRLLSNRALHELENYKEVNLFLRGIVPLIGFKSDIVTYERNERFAGESKYPLKKMLSFAFDGITSFSIKPIRMITGLGFFVFFISLVLLIYSIVGHILGNTSPGWTSLITSIWALGGLQLLAIGVVGEYVGKVYMESKARPRFIIEKFLKNGEDE